MFGNYDDVDLTATDYLADISASSRKMAMVLLLKERERSDEMRLWCFDVLEEVAWGFHGSDCSCPLALYDDIRVRVRGSARAIRRSLDDGSKDTGTWEFIHATDREQFINELLVSEHLAASLGEVKAELERELSLRQAALDRQRASIHEELEPP